MWAVQALRRELLGFRFDYPVEAIQGAGPADSLHYYVYSDRLFLDDLEFDRNGIAMKHYRAQGSQYNPLFVAWWGLFNLEQYLRVKEDKFLQTFLIQVEWLRTNAVERKDGAVVWPIYFDWQEGYCRLRTPWISAMYQGVVISALVRGYRVGGDKGLLALCEQAARVFEKSIEDGGVRTIEQGRVLYEEYPGYPLARVLDGFLISLLGLYDLAIETGRPDVRRLFEQGIQGLRQTLRYWDYRGKWSWYGTHAYLCPPHYHKFNGVLLSVLGNLTGNETLKRYAALWDVKALSPADKLEIFLVFTVTKNWARLRLPRN
jgi:hypothetical protein